MVVIIQNKTSLGCLSNIPLFIILERTSCNNTNKAIIRPYVFTAYVGNGYRWFLNINRQIYMNVHIIMNRLQQKFIDNNGIDIIVFMLKCLRKSFYYILFISILGKSNCLIFILFESYIFEFILKFIYNYILINLYQSLKFS